MSKGIVTINGREIHYWTEGTDIYTSDRVTQKELDQLISTIKQTQFVDKLNRYYTNG